MNKKTENEFYYEFCFNRDYEKCKKILDSVDKLPFDICTKVSSSLTLLKYILERVNFDEKYLKAVTKYDNNLLHLTALNGNLESVKYLYSITDDWPSDKNWEKFTPLEMACANKLTKEENNFEIFDFLVSKGHPVNKTECINCSYNHPNVINYITELR